MVWYPDEISEVRRFTTPLYQCSYLANERASLRYRVIVDLSARDYHELLQRGWRRFGCEFFRPACPACSKCRSLRIPLNIFSPSRSQRRTLKRNSDVEIVVQPPTLTGEHLRLFNAYHSYMHAHRGWPFHAHTAESYYRSFLFGEWDFAREFLYFKEGRLVGVGLADVTSEAISSIYFFHDPAWRADAPGVFSVLQQLAYAQQYGLQYQYLGYWVAESQSMAYKAQYRPHELLARYPDDSEQPVWIRPSTDSR